MVGCCAVGCTNSNDKGFIMKRFPSNPVRRMIWAAQMKRENWTPTDASRLCEVHFTPEMFEQHRADGLRRLRWNAIPTIFPNISQNKNRKSLLKRSSKIKKIICEPTDQSVLTVDNTTNTNPLEDHVNANYCDEEENYEISKSIAFTIKVEPGLTDDMYHNDVSKDDTRDFLAGCNRLKEEPNSDSVNLEEHQDSMTDCDYKTHIKQEDWSCLHYPLTGIKIKTEPDHSEYEL